MRFPRLPEEVLKGMSPIEREIYSLFVQDGDGVNGRKE